MQISLTNTIVTVAIHVLLTIILSSDPAAEMTNLKYVLLVFRDAPVTIEKALFCLIDETMEPFAMSTGVSRNNS